ncbi:MAG: amidohydrolase, partial [Chitinophagales bacterium]
MKHHLLILFITSLFFSCKSKMQADTLFFNAKIYTVDAANPTAEALVVKDGKIVFAGKKVIALNQFKVKTQVDFEGKYMYPGFIDAHSHFTGYGLDLSKADLVGTNSWYEVIERLKAYGKTHPDGWIFGRGWDQNDWQQKDFPTNTMLNELFPEQPVFLKRIDGHACIANQKALDLAHITSNKKIAGGEIAVENGKLTGLLLDNAMDTVEKKIPRPGEMKIEEALLTAQQYCFAVGLTTVDDAGLEKNKIDIIDKLQKDGKLKMRIYAMVADDDTTKNYFYLRGPYKTDRLNVRAIKYYADGALGSRGAMLLKPYSDDTRTQGLQLRPTVYYEEQAKKCLQYGFQMCTHAIGDSANRMMLLIYGKVLGGPNDKRWRIEHCQVVAPDDFALFRQYNIVPSVQPTHATSDMTWAINRLGVYRIKGAYAYKDLMNENAWLANGSDFPVEDINPLFGFYAAVAR